MRRRWVKKFAVIVALCAAAGAANAQSAHEPLPAPGASDVVRTVTPGFRFAAPAQAAAIPADRLLLLAPDGAAVRGLVRTSGDRAVFEPLCALGRLYHLHPLAECARARARPIHHGVQRMERPVQIDDSHTAHKVDLPVSGTQVAATADGGFVAVGFRTMRAAAPFWPHASTRTRRSGAARKPSTCKGRKPGHRVFPPSRRIARGASPSCGFRRRTVATPYLRRAAMAARGRPRSGSINRAAR
jgi:hypothetical protein